MGAAVSGRIALAVLVGLVLAHLHVRCPFGLPSPPVLTLAAMAALAVLGAVLGRLVLADRRAGLRSGGPR